ncbi:MAG TPA: Ig-like domain-containing protein [Mycobacteriales bacterium]|nr:Ig-like domain-containing protein [Mycobacteriales bacterium]
MALLPRRTALAAVLAIGVAGLQPMIAGQAFGATSLGTPTSLAPNSATTPQKDPVLSWSNISGASGYQVEVSKSSDFSDPNDMVKLPDGGTPKVASYSLPQTLVHGVYFWRVRATDASAKGNWSGNAQLDRAWSDAPSTTASTPGTDATATQTGIADYPWRFAWTPLPDASSYEIELSIYPTFAATNGKINDLSTTTACLTDATSFTPYSTYGAGAPDVNVDNCVVPAFGQTPIYWRVRGIDDSNSSQVAEASQNDTLECFGTADNPTTTFPNSGVTTANALGTPTSKGQECSQWSTTKSVGLPTVGDGSLPASSLGNVSGVSLDCPTGTQSDYACTSMPEISWQPVAHADSYVVTIADDANFTNDERVYQTQFLSVTPRDQLADYTAGSGYYVAVQACTSSTTDVTENGCTTPEVASFTKQTPKVTHLTATKVTDGVRLSWSDLAANYATTTGTQSADAEDYKVEVASATNSADDITTTVDAACDATVATCYRPPGTSAAGADQVVVEPKASGSYTWRVLPVDLTGNVLPGASGSAFTVDLTRPAFHITTKSGLAVSSPLKFRSSEPVTGVSTSTVHIVAKGEPLADAVAGRITAGAGANSWVFTPSKPLTTGQAYVLSVNASVRDQSGNSAEVTGSAVRTTTAAKDTSKGWTFKHSWKKISASGARSGSYRSASKGASASVVIAGAEAKLYACKGPTMGDLTVSVAGHTNKVSEHQSFTKCGLEVWHHALPKGQEKLTVTVTKGTGNVDEVTV